MASWEDAADGAATVATGDLRTQLKRVALSDATLKLFESEQVDLDLLLELDAESLGEIEFQPGERDKLVAFLGAVKTLRARCKELNAAIPE
mmetsp:Transcript_24658/g.74010  ORF Transcript_24658/g.74010 Transcript_24658/m.74010 type:complete len:91 (-) Transcript_24658:21-293(-)